jgi:hypothetical protein
VNAGHRGHREDKGKGFNTEVAEGPQRERRQGEAFSPQRTRRAQRKERKSSRRRQRERRGCREEEEKKEGRRGCGVGAEEPILFAKCAKRVGHPARRDKEKGARLGPS